MRPEEAVGKTTTEEIPCDARLPFSLRRMEGRDVPDVMKIERRSFPTPWPESAYHYEIHYRSNSRFYVLQPRGVTAPRWRERLMQLGRKSESDMPPILGYFGLRLLTDRAHLANIAVHPAWRRRGLGEFLLLAALEEAFEYEKWQITLEVRPSNRVAIKLYARLGFHRTGVRRTYYQDGEDAVLMTLGPVTVRDMRRLRARRRAIEAKLVERFVEKKQGR
ncbi:MAG: ribosomal protein S18-alanine N-acetyltransferase [Anaerolineae bacterium]